MRSELRWPLAAVGYLALAVLLTWPLGLHLGSALPGFESIDANDTVGLRGLVPSMLGTLPTSHDIYWPTGYPLLWLVPNLVDHLTGGLLAWLLPFPLADNLWWLAVMVANGLAAHSLGRQLGGHSGGALLGVAWLCSEPLMRELNLHHAPQSLVMWAPLYVGAALRALRGEGSGWKAGLFMGLAAVSYWYLALFLALATVPLAAWTLRSKAGARQLGVAVLVSLVALPALAPVLGNWDKLPNTDRDFAPPPLEMREALDEVPEHLRFVVEQSADPTFAVRSTPLDRSNRLSLVLLLAAVVGSVRQRRGLGLGVAALGAVMVLGPYLKWGEDPTGTLLSLPFRWLGALHPFFERLTWPQRWGLLIPLGLGMAAARAPRAWAWAPFVLLEALLFSGNTPVQTRSLAGLDAWKVLRLADGPILELPLSRSGTQAALPMLHRRYHGRSLANPFLLPPGAQVPPAWNTWAHEDGLVGWLLRLENGGVSGPPGQADPALAALALDAYPGSALSLERIEDRIEELSRWLGPPDDLGAVAVWWLHEPTGEVAVHPDGPGWRAAEVQRLRAQGHPELNTLMEPIVNPYSR